MIFSIKLSTQKLFRTVLFLFWLIYSIKKRNILNIVISALVLIFLLSFYFTNDIDELRFNKEKAKNDLKFLKIDLKDDFEIIDNDVSGMPERFQQTKLKISKNDAERIINEIKSSKNFKELKTSEDIEKDSDNGEKWTLENLNNYKYPEFYSRGIYTREEGYPTRFLFYIEENNDTISYQRIED